MKEEIDGGLLQIRERRRDRIYDALAIFLGLFSLCIGFLIYAHNDEDGVYISKIFHQDVSFAKFNAKINSFFDSFLSFTNREEAKEKPVLGEVNYVQLGDDWYQSDSTAVSALTSGTVLYITEEADSTYSAVLSYGSFEALYMNLTDVEVKAADRLKGGDSIGGYEGKFKCYFRQGERYLSYDQIFLL